MEGVGEKKHALLNTSIRIKKTGMGYILKTINFQNSYSNILNKYIKEHIKILSLYSDITYHIKGREIQATTEDGLSPMM